MADHPSAARVVAQMLDARLRATSQALLEALYLPAETRVLRRLSDLAALYVSPSIPFTQDDLASLAGTTRQTVNRVLGQAQEDGLVQLSRGRITVTNKSVYRAGLAEWPRTPFAEERLGLAKREQIVKFQPAPPAHVLRIDRMPLPAAVPDPDGHCASSERREQFPVLIAIKEIGLSQCGA